MDENNNEQPQSFPLNQTSQSSQNSRDSNAIQPSVQPAQTATNNFEQSSTDQQLDNRNPDGELKPNRRKKFVLILIIVLTVIALLVVGVFASQKYLNSKNEKITEQLALTNTPTVAPTETETKTSDTGCDNFSDMLESCAEYKCQFTHPLTGEQMTKEIKGLRDDKCIYLEQMPNGGKMDCEYTEEMRLAIAKYQKDLGNTGTFEAKMSAKLQPEGAEVTTTYTVDGKVVDNPLQDALDTGQCVVSGY